MQRKKKRGKIFAYLVRRIPRPEQFAQVSRRWELDLIPLQIHLCTSTYIAQFRMRAKEEVSRLT